jgi:hypothetical protein
MSETFTAEFDFSQCKSSFAIPASDGNLVLICINNQTQEIWSYSYNRNTSDISQTNVIQMPFTEFLGSAVDMNERRLILFTKTYASDMVAASEMVVHIFAVQTSVIWIGNTTIEDGDMQWNDVASISYNTHAKRGVLVGHPHASNVTNDTQQMISVFEMNVTYPYISEIKSINISVSGPVADTQYMILKTEISSEGFIYALQLDNQMAVYQVYGYYEF